MTTTTPVVEDPPVRGRRRGRRRRYWVLVITMVVVAAAAGVVVLHPFHDGSKPAGIDSGAATALASVTGGDLTAQTQVSGTLGYAGDYSVVNQATGTITRLPATGQVVGQGHVLYEVAGKPVILLYGPRAPMYRAMSEGMTGDDVRQLNADLVALGYTSAGDLDPHSDYFSAATAYALEKLQGDVGAEQTGRLDTGQAVFLPTAKARITRVNATVGGAAAPGPLLAVSSTARRVTVALDAATQSSVKVGDSVTITLPDTKTIPGRVSAVGTVATKGGDGSLTINVQITPADPAATGRLDQAPVQVSIVTGSVHNALSVPVNALLALAGGGYAVEVADRGGVRRLVPVTVGLFDDGAGLVQVSGAGLAAGECVVVPAS